MLYSLGKEPPNFNIQRWELSRFLWYDWTLQTIEQDRLYQSSRTRPSMRLCATTGVLSNSSGVNKDFRLCPIGHLEVREQNLPSAL